MRKWAFVTLLCGVLVGAGVCAPAFAVPSLQEILFNANGTTFHNTYALPGLSSAGFDPTTGLGTLTLTFDPGVAGSYFFDVFFDHQLHDQFYNEYGAVNGAPGAGITWQIDEPGFGDGNRTGSIFTNTQTNALDNTNYVPGTLSNVSNDCGANTSGQPVNASCNNDVAMALGFNFILAANEFASITVTASPTEPAGGFFLRQHDPDTPSDLFLTGRMTILPSGPTPIPEPSSVVLFITGVVLALGVVRRRF